MAAATGPELVARFMADTKDLEKAVRETSATTQKTLTDMAKGAAAAFAGAFAVDKVVDFGRKVAMAAAEDMQAQTALATTMRNVTQATDEQIASSEAYLSAMSKQVGVADDELRPAYDKLIRGTGDTAEAQKLLAIAMDASVGTGKDLASISDAIMKAAMGQTTGLQRLGIATTDAAGATLSFDQIMQNMQATFGGQAENAANTTAGQIKNLKVQMSELLETIGHALLPILQKLMDFLVNVAIPGLQRVVTAIRENEVLFESLGVALKALALIIMIAMVPSLYSMAAGVVAATWPFLLIVAVIAGLVILFKTFEEEIRGFFEAVWAIVGPTVMAIVDIVKSLWDIIIEGVKLVWSIVEPIFNFIWDLIKAVFNWISQHWQEIATILFTPFKTAVAVIKTVIESIKPIITAVVDFIKWRWDALVAILKWPFESGWDFIKSVFQWIKDAATSTYNFIVNIFSSIANAITAPIKYAWNALANVWNGTVGNISMTIPEWVPGVGGNSFDMPNLPYLARGGVLTKPTLFVGGEAGTEIVSPEAMLRAIVREESGGKGKGDSYVLNMYPRTASPADVAFAFRRLELMSGVGIR